MEALRVGSFTLERPIAAGGMGRVWQAVHPSGVSAAVKIISPDAVVGPGPDPVAGLQAEIRSIAALDHPNVVAVYDAGVLGPEHEGMSGGRLMAGSPWLAMELAEGSIRDLADELDWPMLMHLLVQALDALAHAHARGVVHRDLKPGNALYTRASGDLRLLLADFGLAWAWRRSSDPLDGGTAAFSAPEQLLGQLPEQGPWTDLYGLGCTAFRLLCGRPPYRGSTFEDLKRAHVFGDIPRLTPRFECPNGLEEWIAGMIAKDPQRRFQRAADAAWALLQLPSTAVTAVSVPATTLPVTLWVQDPESPALPAIAAEVRPPVPLRWTKPEAVSAPIEGRGLGVFGMAVPPMVGRQAERQRLWDTLVGGTGLQLAVLSGPGGVGRSRLGAWVCERAHELGTAEVFRTRFSSDTEDSAGLASMLEEHLRTHGMTASEVHAHLTMAAHVGSRHDDDLAPEELTRLLRPYDTVPPMPTLSREQRAELVWRFMSTRCQGRRLLVWLDDADLGSEAFDLVHHLSVAAADHPGMVLLTVREPLAPSVSARLTDLSEALPTFRTALAPLDHASSMELVTGMLPVTDALASRIADASEGLPVAAVQLMAELVQRGQLRGGADRVEVDTRVPLPDSLASLYAGALLRLDVLGAQGRGALEVAAVLGARMSLPEWREACQLLDIGLEPRLLADMTTRGFIRPERGGGTYAFGQGVLRDALLDALGRDGRIERIHLACGQVLEARGETRAARAGWHLEAAGHYLAAANAYLTAMRWLASWDRERAMQLGAQWYAAFGRVAQQGDPRWADGMKVLVQLLQLQGGDAHVAVTEQLLQHGRGDPQAETLALIELARADLEAQSLQRALARAELAWRGAKGTELQASAAAIRAEVRRCRGELGQAVQIVEEALLAEPDAVPLVLSQVHVLCDDDRATEALLGLESWMERNTRDDPPLLRARVYHARGAALLAMGEPEAALSSLDQARELRDQGGFDWPALDLDLAAVFSATGEPALARTVLDALLERLDVVRDPRNRSSALAQLAELEAEACAWDALETHVDALEDLPGPGRARTAVRRLRRSAALAEGAGHVTLARRLRALAEGSLP